MRRAGRRYSLLLYTRMMDRWWPAVMALGLSLFALAWEIRAYFPEPAMTWRWQTLGGVGALSLLFGFFLLMIRKAAYVRPYGDHLRVVTPFLRLNISYKRIKRSTSATMAGLFPPYMVKGMQREILEPLADRTAIVLNLNGLPFSRSMLRFFLSPFFFKFKDQTPHIVLLVGDWMRFSAELESLRAGGEVGTPRRVSRSILSRLRPE